MQPLHQVESLWSRLGYTRSQSAGCDRLARDHRLRYGRTEVISRTVSRCSIQDAYHHTASEHNLNGSVKSVEMRRAPGNNPFRPPESMHPGPSIHRIGMKENTLPYRFFRGAPPKMNMQLDLTKNCTLFLPTTPGSNCNVPTVKKRYIIHMTNKTTRNKT